MISLFVTTLVLVASLYALVPRVAQVLGRFIGWHLGRLTQHRRELLLERVASERDEEQRLRNVAQEADEGWEQIDKRKSSSDSEEDAGKPQTDSWPGIVGFLHPFCNAGGGGERVLWAAIRTTQRNYPNAVCVVYTGDHNVNKAQMLQRVKERFNIRLNAPNVMLLYLSQRRYVLASTWPHFTLLGQSIGSIVLAWDAFNLLVPDMFIDTMGYAFASGLSKFLFPTVPTGAYVHYPTISTDMLQSLDASPADNRGLHAGAGKGLRGQAKRAYWHLFAALYCWVGASVDIVMTNSSWTQNHINLLWGRARASRGHEHRAEVVFPPCAVEDIERDIEISPTSEKSRMPRLLYIAQFRPEKNHQMVLRAFAKMLHERNPSKSDSYTEKDPRLLLIGSVRDSADETYIYSLRLLAHELHITSAVSFIPNASWPIVLGHLRTASVGVNAMWNEHFGIGVVEYQAAGLISVVNDSGGPRNDICIDEGQGPTGYHASDDTGYAEGFKKALALNEEEALAFRLRARHSSRRFNEASFDAAWQVHFARLIELQRRFTNRKV